MTTPTPTRREERRLDRLTEARIDREAADAQVKNRITERKAARDTRDRKHAARSARWANRSRWLGHHVTDLLFVPVIGVPGILAWEAMAAYGSSVWGPLGIILPAFSEGAMWAFDAAVEIRRHRNEKLRDSKPVWHLQIGIAVFAAYGAALNFLHGMAPGTAHHGPVIAVSMALISVAGVTARQLVTAGPRRSGSEREAARIRGLAERRRNAAIRAALRTAKVELDGTGSARLVYAAGVARMTRKWGHAVLTVEPVKPQAVAAIEGSPEPRGEPVAMTPPVVPGEPPPAVADDPSPQVPDDLRDEPQDDPREGAPDDPQHDPVPAPRDDPPATPAKRPSATRRRTTPRTPRLKTEKVAQLLRAGVPVAEIKARTGASDSTIKRAKVTLAQPAQVVDIADRRKALSRLRPHPPPGLNRQQQHPNPNPKRNRS